MYEAHDPHGPLTFVDETALVQSAGFRVSTVPGDTVNLKVTLPGDEKLAIARLATVKLAPRMATVQGR